MTRGTKKEKIHMEDPLPTNRRYQIAPSANLLDSELAYDNGSVQTCATRTVYTGHLGLKGTLLLESL